MTYQSFCGSTSRFPSMTLPSWSNTSKSVQPADLIGKISNLSPNSLTPDHTHRLQETRVEWGIDWDQSVGFETSHSKNVARYKAVPLGREKLLKLRTLLFVDALYWVQSENTVSSTLTLGSTYPHCLRSSHGERGRLLPTLY